VTANTLNCLGRYLIAVARAGSEERTRNSGQYPAPAPIVGAVRTSNLVALTCSSNVFESDHVLREVHVAGD
jgi:hypothetical protein